jgi:Ni/Co efflux regulator RcnB
MGKVGVEIDLFNRFDYLFIFFLLMSIKSKKMKRILITVVAILTLATNLKAQNTNKFRMDYSMISVYNAKTDTWTDWSSGENTFVINYNNNGDIAHFKPNGGIVVYKKISGVEEGYAKNRKHYQIIKALDEDGDVFSFQIFDDPTIGLKLMYRNVIIQFVNSN